MERLEQYTNNILFKISFEYTIAKLIVCLVLGILQMNDAFLALIDLCSWTTGECYVVFAFIGLDIFTAAVIVSIIVDIAARKFYRYVKDQNGDKKEHKDINII